MLSSYHMGCNFDFVTPTPISGHRDPRECISVANTLLPRVSPKG